MNDRIPEPAEDTDYTCPYCRNLQNFDELLPDEVDNYLVWRCAFCRAIVGISDFILAEVYA